jgi:hypothetical protein|tara:strand:+ start:3385 stop:3636 length:252 start_codon:yes stop_codon:yes gene_type:complete
MSKDKIKKDFIVDENDPVQKLLREMRVMHDEKVELDKRLFEIFLFQVEQLHRTSSNSPTLWQGIDDDVENWEDVKKLWWSWEC